MGPMSPGRCIDLRPCLRPVHILCSLQAVCFPGRIPTRYDIPRSQTTVHEADRPGKPTTQVNKPRRKAPRQITYPKAAASSTSTVVHLARPCACPQVLSHASCWSPIALTTTKKKNTSVGIIDHQQTCFCFDSPP